MNNKQRQESQILGMIRSNKGKNSVNRLRNMERFALNRADEDKEAKSGVLELCACRDWGRGCERSVEKRGILFCPEMKPECVARGKERR
jgi:hypothetical protein